MAGGLKAPCRVGHRQGLRHQGGEGGRVSEIERMIARQYEQEFGAGLAKAQISASMLAQMTLGLYYGQVNHQLAFGLPFESEPMRTEMRVMMGLLLCGVRAGE